MQAFAPYETNLRAFISTEFGGFTPARDKGLERQLKQGSQVVWADYNCPCWQREVTLAYAHLQVGDVVTAWEVAVEALRLKFITENYEASAGDKADHSDPRSYDTPKWDKDAAIAHAHTKVANIAKGYLEPLIRAYREQAHSPTL